MTVFVALILGGLLYISLVRLFVRNFVLGWVCVLIANGFNFTVGSDAALLGGIHINPLDLLYFSLLPAGIIRCKFHELKFSILNILISGYVLLFFLSVARGLTVFDVTTVGNEGRGLIGEVLALTYFTTIPHDSKVVKKVVIAQIAYSAALVLVCILHYGGLPVGGSVGVTQHQAVVENNIDRALPATAIASVELSLIFAASWAVYRKHKRWLPPLVGLFTVTVVILQHRTVWAMLVITVATAAFLDRRLFRFLVKIAGTIAAIGCLVGLSYIGLRTQLQGQLQESATNSDTLQWRFESWERSIEQDQSALTMLIGMPVGSGYTRLDTNSGGYTDYPPHDELINQYLRVGVIGVVLLTLFLVRPIYGYIRSPDSGTLLYPTASAWVLVTIGVIVFGIPYSSSVELMALVGMANSLIDAPAPERKRAPLARPPLGAGSVAQPLATGATFSES